MWRNLAPSLFFALALLLGVAFGTQLDRHLLSRRIAAHADVSTLGQVIERLDPRDFAQAYYDPEAALAEMREYAWVVPQVPTPGVGSAPAPGRHANATINEQQFRRREPVAVPKPAGVIRIFLTGGSTAFGCGAPDDDRTISGYLERELRARTARDIEVIDAANPAWATTHERSWIVDRLVDFQPDLVISLSGNNDVHWGAKGRNVLFMRTYAEQHYFDELAWLYARAREPLPDVVPVSEKRVAPRLVASRLARNVRQSLGALQDHGARYLFALQPDLAVTGKPLTRKERWQRRLMDDRFGPGAVDYFGASYAAIRRELDRLASEGLSVADLSDAFDGTPSGQEIFLDSYHFGDRGNDIVAQRLAEAVTPLLEASGR